MQNRNRFDKFTGRARKVLSFAQEEAERFQHNYIGTEHLLLGLIRESEGIAGTVLNNLGVELGKIRNAVEFIIGRGDRFVLGEVGLTPRAKKVIELAVDEARQLHHHYIGTEHILLGLVHEGEGIAAGVLTSMGLQLVQVRTETLRVLAGGDAMPLSELSPEPIGETLRWKYSDNFADYTFTLQSEKVLSHAQAEALILQHNYVGTEHILLGLLHDEDSITTRALKSLGAELARTRHGIRDMMGDSKRIADGEVPLTPLARAQIHMAADEAARLGHTAIRPEHLLLALIRQGEGIALSVLGSLGVDLDALRSKILQEIHSHNQ